MIGQMFVRGVHIFLCDVNRGRNSRAGSIIRYDVVSVPLASCAYTQRVLIASETHLT